MVISIMERNNNLRYKPDQMVSDLEDDLEKILSLYLDAVNSRDFWSGVEKIVFADRWTCLMQRLVSPWHYISWY
jgi:hypothetical protein